MGEDKFIFYALGEEERYQAYKSRFLRELSEDGLEIRPIQEQGKKKQAKNGFQKPTVAEIRAYCQERKNGIDAQAFFDHYTTNGWMRGKSKIKDWKACVRTWEQTERGNSNGQADTRSRAKRVSDKLDEIARADIEKRGFTESLD